jgi:hypothetical protein
MSGAAADILPNYRCSTCFHTPELRFTPWATISERDRDYVSGFPSMYVALGLKPP